MSSVRFAALTPADISFLQAPHTLYSVDFRSTGESLDLPIAAMFKYENLSRWLVNKHFSPNSYVLVNDATDDLAKVEGLVPGHFLQAARTNAPEIAIYERIPTIPNEVRNLWVAVPHPAADTFANAHYLNLNYSYADFLQFNDKLLQKEYLGNYSPQHTTFTSVADFRRALQGANGYVKCRHGAGGFKVIPPGQPFDAAASAWLNPAEDYGKWYEEVAIVGQPYSVQAIQEENNALIVFGFTKQHLDGTIYEGGEVLPLAAMPPSIQTQIEDVGHLIQPFLKQYQGFLGIDFIITPSHEVKVLELNVRLTAITIPTLLHNAKNQEQTMLYREDVADKQITAQDLILTRDIRAHTADILRVVDEATT